MSNLRVADSDGGLCETCLTPATRPATPTDARQLCGHQELVDLIQLWAQAYPPECFPEPDHSQTGHDPTLCSAAMGRHIMQRLMERMPDV